MFTFILGCEKESNQPIFGHSIKYVYTIAWNEIIYGLTNETVSETKLGNVIGEIKYGSIDCNVPECAPPPFKQGGKIREIKGVDQNKALAVETKGNDGYYKIEYYRPLE
ncbi:hypothetical protein [Ammoniphilus sp. 3BR4]|uniref:hypothetical protein n=1 Tax=Ammoniphilus sp. 3BR4 TaxID=3158265 RepID=UPI003467B725